MHEIKNITITPEILKLISEIDEFKGRWTGLSCHNTHAAPLPQMVHLDRSAKAFRAGYFGICEENATSCG